MGSLSLVFTAVMEGVFLSFHLVFSRSQLALPARPLLKMKRVTGVRNSNVQRVSIKLTEIQKAIMTPMMARTFSTSNMPQKSIILIFARCPPCCLR